MAGPAVEARLVRPGPGDEPLAWLTVIMLATYRSTFLPQYGVFPALWLVEWSTGS
jgi:hypothetical protein